MTPEQIKQGFEQMRQFLISAGYQVNPPGGLQPAKPAAEPAIETAAPFKVPCRVQTKDGPTVLISTTAGLIRGRLREEFGDGKARVEWGGMELIGPLVNDD
jgi:hypothetical protein